MGALQLSTITDSISGLTVSGLTIKDIDQIPEAVERNYPVIFPEPINFLSELVATPASFSIGTGSQWNVEYNLTYSLLYAPLGSGRGMEKYASTVALAIQFIDAILAVTTLNGSIEVTPFNISAGPYSDPAGNMFFGAQIILHVLEFVN